MISNKNPFSDIYIYKYLKLNTFSKDNYLLITNYIYSNIIYKYNICEIILLRMLFPYTHIELNYDGNFILFQIFSDTLFRGCHLHFSKKLNFHFCLL